MEESFEFRINYEFAHLLFKPEEGKDIGQITKSVKIVVIDKKDPVFKQIPKVAKQVDKKYGAAFFFYWEPIRSYTKEELNKAKLFTINKLDQFQPTGEVCGTHFDESKACTICGSGRRQTSRLKLKSGTIPKKDIAKTIGGEIVVSEKLVELFKERGLKGATFEPIIFNKGSMPYYQLVVSTEIELTPNTIAGINPFDLSTEEEGEIYKCPKGHTIGLNLLSEVYVKKMEQLNKHDLLISQQKTGVKRGVLRPMPIYLCSPAFRKMIIEEKLSGFNFEVAYVED